MRIKTMNGEEMEDVVRQGMSHKTRQQAGHKPYCCDILREYPQGGCGDTHKTGIEQMIRHQGMQLMGGSLTYRDLVDKIMEGIQAGDFVMSDPVPTDFIRGPAKSVEEYMADKYDIRGDADGQEHQRECSE